MRKDPGTRIEINNPEVAAVFDSYPPNMREKLMVLRQLILQTAAATEGVGELEETLKWGEPSYLTPQTKSGSTVRIAWKKKAQISMRYTLNAQRIWSRLSELNIRRNSSL